MSSPTPSSRPADTNPSLTVRKQLQVSTYDRASSLLIALLVMIGVAVAVLFVIWSTSHLVLSKKLSSVKWVEPGGIGDPSDDLERNTEEPALEELATSSDTQIENLFDIVTDVSTVTAASFESIQLDGIGASRRVEKDGRKSGPIGNMDSNIVPSWDRWEIHFTTAGIDYYARQLDFFDIELGVLGGGSPTVQYAKNFTSTINMRHGKSTDEKRLYMSWQHTAGPIADFDNQLLRRAGIDTDRRTILQFLKRETELQLATAEANAARELGHTDPREFLKTIFGVRPQGSGFEFYVIEQQFRLAPELAAF